MSNRVVLLALGLASTATGCSSFSGLDAKATFACLYRWGHLPVGDRRLRREPPERAPRAAAREPHPEKSPGAKPTPQHGAPLPPGQTGGTRPIARRSRPRHRPGRRSAAAPRILRIWVAPYEDSDGDLRTSPTCTLTVDPGGWEIAHTRRAIRDRFMAIRAAEPASQAAGRAPRLIDPAPLPSQPGPATASVEREPFRRRHRPAGGALTWGRATGSSAACARS